MSMIYRYPLDMVPGGVRTTVRLNQGDEDFTLVFSLYASSGTFTMESGTTAMIRGTKPDGNGYSVDATVDTTAKTVTVEGELQMTAAAGKGNFELTLYHSGKKISTANFTLWTEHAALDQTTVVSDSKVAELYAVENNAAEIIAAGAQYEAYKQALDETAEAAALSAQTASEAKQSVSTMLNEFDASYTDSMQEWNDTYRSSMQVIDDKTAAVAQLTTDAGTTSRQALDLATLASNEVAEFSTQMASMKRNQTAMQLLMDEAFDGAYIENDAIYFTHQGEVVAGPFSGIGGGGGGGGGSDASNNAVLTANNTTGWQAKTIAGDGECVTSITWSSIEGENETGPGTLQVTVNGVTKALLNVPQGTITLNIAPYLMVGSNIVKQTIRDTYGNARTVNFSVEKVVLSNSSVFDSSTPYQGAISFPYTPVGSVEKTIHFILDGREIGTTVTSVSGRQMSYTIPQQSHGAHTFECYFDAIVNGQLVESNRLYYEIICLETLNTTPIIVSDYNKTTAVQYETLSIDYTVYDPIRMEAPVTITANGVQVQSLTVDRTAHTFSYRADTPGTVTIVIACGSTTKSFTLTITESDIHPEAVTDQLALYMTSAGRSNSENNPAVWTYGTGQDAISAEFSDFNWTRDGWVLDEDGYSCLRTMGGSTVTIPYQPYGADFRTTGKCIEIEFSTHDVLDYDVPIISCMNGDRGFSITADHAVFKSARSEVTARYTTDTHLRLTLVVQPQTKNRLVYLYIDGEYAGITQYSGTDSFRQTEPVGITIGNALCGVDVYAIRVYDRDLTDDEVLGNFIADRQDVGEMLTLYRANDIKDEYGNIVINKLDPSLPYAIFTGPESPQYKGDKKTVDLEHVLPTDSARHLVASGVQADVQGTSSQYYAVKNLKIKLKNGATVNGRLTIGFIIREGSIEVNTFTLKADVASCESANNICLVKIYEDLCRYLGILTPPQESDTAIRQGVDGFPCVVFWDYGDGPEFVGKYNWNNDKGTHEVFGFSEGDESWEVKSNTSQLSKFHTATFPDNWNGEDYEPRYPDDYTDNTKLKAMTEFIYSTWQDEATGNALASPVTYDGVQYTTDTAAYRLAKFKDGFPNLYDLDNATFFYVFTLVCLLADDRQKNEFLTYWHEIGKWWELPYDFDTALGTDNRGNLTFEYWMEDIDQFEGEYVFNGADNVKWVNFRQAFWNECRSMYQRMRSSGMFDAAYLKNYFRAWQSAWPTQIWNEDGDYKYVKPLEKDGTTTYLTMAYGSKRWQREEFIDWRIPYIDSMFDVGEALLSIMFRPFYQVTEAQRANGEVDIEVEVYKKSYVTVLWDATKVTHRVVDDTYKCAVENPLAFANDAVCSIHNGKMVRDVKGLEKLYVGFWDSTNAPNLQALRLGSGEAGYRNTATKTVSVGANEKLVYVDMRNCVNFGTADQKTLDLAHCKNIQEVYLDGTSCMGVDLPNGGVLEILHLPATTTSIVIRNHPKLTDIGLSVASYNSIDQLWLENMTGLDTLDILRAVPEGTAIRITGFYWEAEDAEEIEGIFDLFDSMIGLDINSEEVEKAQLSGTIHTSALRGDDIAAWNERYPTVTVIADSVASYLYYKTWDGSQTLKTVTCVDGVPQDTTAPAGPSRADTERFRYTFVGWNTQQDASTAETGYLDDVLADRSVYAAYSRVALTYLAYKTWDDATLIKTVTCVDGVPEESSPSGPTRTSTAQYDYSFVGWNLSQDAQTADASCITNVSADRTVYAAYSRTVRQYTVTWMNAGNTTITTETYDYGDTPSFKGTTPTYQGQTSTGWLPAISAVTGNITYTAQYKPMYTATFVRASADGGGTLYTQQNVVEGSTPVYGGATPTSTQGSAEDYPFESWTPALAPIYANTTYTAKFGSPVEDVEITDSWDTIIASIDAGTYKTKYKIGNYKPLDLGTEGTVNMQIVAFDADDLASGGKAPLTFIAKELFANKHCMGGNKINWADSDVKTYLNSTIISLIPPNIAARVQTVTKKTRTNNGIVSSSEKLWIPSIQEIYDYDAPYSEKSGVRYNKIYPYSPSSSRVKYINGTGSLWWTRSSTAVYYRIDAYGYIDSQYGDPQYTAGVCLGFCLGLESETITDSWSEIFANEANGTYSTKYSIGDTKMLDLGTEGQHLMEIVAFDTDDKADGTGKAKITWISKDLPKTMHRMNPTNDTSNYGWSSSEMRTYLKDTIKPLIPQTVSDSIVSVNKITSALSSSALTQITTTDDVWIPSDHEVGLGTNYEVNGAVYSSKFTDDESRVKKRNGSVMSWGLRSTHSNGYFRIVRSDGSSHFAGASSVNGVAFGFCT